MLTYLATIALFLGSVAVCVDRMRRGSGQQIGAAFAATVASYALMLTTRDLDAGSGMVALMTVDLAIGAIGISGAIRLLGGWDEAANGEGGDDDGPGGGGGNDGPGGGAPARPGGGSGVREPGDGDGAGDRDWGAFDRARRGWEAGPGRRPRPQRLLPARPHRPLRPRPPARPARR